MCFLDKLLTVMLIVFAISYCDNNYCFRHLAKHSIWWHRISYELLILKHQTVVVDPLLMLSHHHECMNDFCCVVDRFDFPFVIFSFRC